MCCKVFFVHLCDGPALHRIIPPLHWQYSWLPPLSAEESQAVTASFSPPHKTLYIIVVIITELVCWFSNNSLMLHGGGTNTAACGLELTAGEFLQRLHFKSYSLYPKLSRYICQGP